ncbi:MAG: hypothetical protein HYS86_01970 [Candidatus Chisholmbacteria bacterium]|nr:hypothetical protein [Candidatus Chisholmbacteria bacterium]
MTGRGTPEFSGARRRLLEDSLRAGWGFVVGAVTAGVLGSVTEAAEPQQKDEPLDSQIGRAVESNTGNTELMIAHVAYLVGTTVTRLLEPHLGKFGIAAGWGTANETGANYFVGTSDLLREREAFEFGFRDGTRENVWFTISGGKGGPDEYWFRVWQNTFPLELGSPIENRPVLKIGENPNGL